MKYQWIIIGLFSCSLSLVGCQGGGMGDTQVITMPGAEIRTVNQGYALIYDTIKQESQVDKILILKGPSEDVSNVLKAIAKLSSNAKAKIEEFDKADASLSLKKDGIPKAESLTREAISSSTTKRILFSSSKAFEFNILLAQHQALDYISSMAKMLSEQDRNETRKQYMAELAEDTKALHERVLKLMRDAYMD
ncbi:MAG: hypothetical protein ACF8OB_10420 [Phycisphaeraceae bacterium JB051]